MERATLVDGNSDLKVKFVITAEKIYLTKSELGLCTGSNPDCAMSEVCDNDNLQLWCWMEISVKVLSSVNHSTEVTMISPSEHCLKLTKHYACIVS